MKKVSLLFFGLLAITTAFAQNTPLWMRYPAISPDGKTIVFSYKGDLYKVSADGGTALPLTMHEAHDYQPVWSHDGKMIAFASDRYGNFDVFVMPAEGGTPVRLTANSANDYPYDFSPDDQQIIFGSVRHTVNTNVRFPAGRLFNQLYTVPVKGGRSVLISATGMEHAQYNSDGSMLVYQDRKGTEDPWRKHHTSSVTRDVWLYDTKAKTYSQFSKYEGEDREPLFSSDDQYVYYLSEKNGAQNIFKAPIKLKIAEQQLTSFKNHPVRHLTRAKDNTLCFTWNGEIYTIKNDGAPKKLNITITSDAKSNEEKIVQVAASGGEIAVSPNGKEVAIVFRGEVFVTSVEGGITKRITNTPQQERMVEFGADGKTIYYSTERNGSWDIYKTSIVRKEEPYFYASTLLKEEPVLATDKEEFQPLVSPDGKEIAYLEERNILKVYNIASKQSRTIIAAGVNFSYRDGDQEYTWSPDSKWIAVRSNKGAYSRSEVVLYKADGTDKTGTDLTESGFNDGGQQFVLDGKALIWGSDKYGKKPLAYQGAREADIFIMFFDKEAYDRFRLNKDDYALLKEREDKTKKDSAQKAKDSIAKKNWAPLLENLDERKIRLTNASGNINSFALSANGEKLWYIATNERNTELWEVNTRTRESKVLTRLGNGANFVITADGKALFVISDQGILKIETETAKTTPVSIRSEMVLNTAGERAYIFEHAWRQVKKKFYDPKLHGLDWEMYRDNYARFLPHINNNYDFQELLSEILGELNASHTGGRYSPQNPNGDQTASLGLFYDEFTGGDGLKVTEVITGGPLDVATSKIKPGVIIEKIDGEAITNGADWATLLNRKAGKNVLLSVFDPARNERFEETVKPIAGQQEQGLLYNRWVNMMRKMVDKLSNGKVGYVHVQGMNDGSYRTVYEEVMGRNADKEALIVDTRFNGGGWLHDDLVTFLGGKKYLTFAPYGFSSKGQEPLNKWVRPSCVLMSESNYSDAFIFPYAYKNLGIGPLIGKPVPGTGTAVWWETQIDPTLVFGIPMIATIGKEGRPTENLQINADFDVALPYDAFINGKDTQIEKAVEEMLKAIGKK
jgi:Tol biopolymer transport system component/C-terminal processing protease CtpA/Prc